MQNTTWFNLNKPDGTDAVDVSKLNENMDTIDQELHKAQLIANNQADAYDDTGTYSVGDLVIYGNVLYKCITTINTAEAWDAEHWEPTTLAKAISTGGGMNYSTEERVIGTWIDGKPLYQKTILKTIDTGDYGAEFTYDHGIEDIDVCVHAEGHFQTVAGSIQFNRIQPVVVTSSSTSINGELIACLYNFNKTELTWHLGRIWSTGAINIQYLVATVQYTKTTD